MSGIKDLSTFCFQKQSNRRRILQARFAYLNLYRVSVTE